MRLKPRKGDQTRDPNVCSAARCSAEPTVIHSAGILDKGDVYLCDRHWVAYCAETEAEAVAELGRVAKNPEGTARAVAEATATVGTYQPDPELDTAGTYQPEPADELPLVPPRPPPDDANAAIEAMLNPKIRNLPKGGLKPGAYTMQIVGPGEVEIVE